MALSSIIYSLNCRFANSYMELSKHSFETIFLNLSGQS